MGTVSVRWANSSGPTSTVIASGTSTSAGSTPSAPARSSNVRSTRSCSCSRRRSTAAMPASWWRSIAPTIAKRIGTRNVLLLGVGVFGLGLALLATMVSAAGGYWSVIPGLLVVSFGIGLCMSPSTTTITESLPHEKQGVASALNDTVRELGGAIGIALLGSLVSAGYRSSVSGATAQLAPGLANRVEEGIGSAFGAA